MHNKTVTYKNIQIRLEQFNNEKEFDPRLPFRLSCFRLTSMYHHNAFSLNTCSPQPLQNAQEIKPGANSQNVYAAKCEEDPYSKFPPLAFINHNASLPIPHQSCPICLFHLFRKQYAQLATIPMPRSTLPSFVHAATALAAPPIPHLNFLKPPEPLFTT